MFQDRSSWPFTKSGERCLKHLLCNTEAEMWWSWKTALNTNFGNAFKLMILAITEISKIFFYLITRWFKKYGLYFESLGLINDGYGGHLIVLDIRDDISFQQKITPAHTIINICVVLNQPWTEAYKEFKTPGVKTDAPIHVSYRARSWMV